MISISHWGLNLFHDAQYAKIAVRHHEGPRGWNICTICNAFEELPQHSAASQED